MTQQTNGMPELKYSEETFRELYEALRKIRALTPDTIIYDIATTAISKAEEK